MDPPGLEFSRERERERAGLDSRSPILEGSKSYYPGKTFALRFLS